MEDISITRTSTTWGVTVPWNTSHVFYVWYDALVNYLTAIGYGEDEERFDDVVAVGAPSAGQGHHPIPLRVVAGDVHGGRHRASRSSARPWLAARRGQATVEDAHPASRPRATPIDGTPIKLTDINPSALVEDFGIDPVRYYLLRDTPLGTDGDFSYEGIAARYNSDLANNLGNLVSRVATLVVSKCGGVGPAPDPNSPLAALSAAVVADTIVGVGRVPTASRLGGHVAAHP